MKKTNSPLLTSKPFRSILIAVLPFFLFVSALPVQRHTVVAQVESPQAEVIAQLEPTLQEPKLIARQTVDSKEAVAQENEMQEQAVPEPFEQTNPVAGIAASDNPAAMVHLEPAGCRMPSENYLRLWVRGNEMNQRTYDMLAYAAELYDGNVDILGSALMRGGYERNSANPVYQGGGVVDLSMMNHKNGQVYYGEIEPLVLALRSAGFAAWMRLPNELYPGSKPHIHAVAIGDRRLSAAAQAEINGDYGYFNGYNGITPQANAPAQVDPHGGAVLCNWMLDTGYTAVVRGNHAPSAWLPGQWQERLRNAAEAYLTNSMEESIVVARRLAFVDGKIEHPANMCGPLAAAILRDAGLLPPNMLPAFDLHNYWLANPHLTDRPWSLFPRHDYTVTRHSGPAEKFDFSEWPLLPGDFVYTYAVANGYDHMFVVSEVDDQGRAYSVANERQDDGSYLIQRVLLYDPADPAVGAFRKAWVESTKRGQTGQGGFSVLRRNGLSMNPGSLFSYTVVPGDTFISIAEEFNSEPAQIARQNGLELFTNLQLGQVLEVPVQIASSGEKISALGQTTLVSNIYPVAIMEDGIQAYDDEPQVRFDSLIADQVDFQAKFEKLTGSMLSGDWGFYIENLETGEVYTMNEKDVFHPASTIKIAVGAAFLHWMDENPQKLLSNGPVWGERSFEQLLKAMLIKSEEEATTILINFLKNKPGFDVQSMLSTWGLEDTTILPRRSTPADQALLLKRLYKGELLSAQSTSLLLSLLKTLSNGDDVRLGGGLPEWARMNLAHKPGTVFEDGWGVVSDVGLLEMESGSFVVVVMSNYVEWVDYQSAETVIEEISQIVFEDIMKDNLDQNPHQNQFKLAAISNHNALPKYRGAGILSVSPYMPELLD